MASDNLDDFKLDGLEDLDLDMSDPFESLRSRSKLKSLTMGILSGAKSELSNFGFYAKTIRKSIPDSFKRTIDSSDNIKFGIGISYNKIATDYKSEINDLKSIMPDSVAGLLPNTDNDYEYTHNSDLTDDQNYAAGINAQLEHNEKIASGRLRRDNNIDRLKLRGATLQVEHLKGINDRLSAGLRSKSLGLKMAEKSLEIQYRHYNVALKTFELLHNSSKNQLRALSDIIRNTSLSDAFKHSMSQGKNGGVGKSIVSRFSGNLGHKSTKAIEKLTTRFGMINPIMSQLNMAKDMGDLISPWEMGGNVIGSVLAEYGGDYVSGKIKSKLSKNSRTAKFGKSAGNISSSAMARARYIASKKRFNAKNYMSDSEGYTAQIANWLKLKANSSMDGLSGVFSGGLEDRKASKFKNNFNDSTTTSIHTNKSLTTIIPGYLARILREVTISNTGDANTSLLSYSIDRDRFVTQKRKNGDLIKTMSSFNNKGSSKDIRSAVSGIDKDNMLSASAKKAMEVQLLHGASNDMNFYHKNFTDSTYYHEGISKRDKNELIRFFRKNNFDSTEFGNINEALIDSTRNSKDELDRFYQAMDLEIQKGNLDGLVAMGLVKRDRSGQPNFDEKAIYEFMLGTKGDKSAFSKLMSSSKIRASGRGEENIKKYYKVEDVNTDNDIKIKGFGNIKSGFISGSNNIKNSIISKTKGIANNLSSNAVTLKVKDVMSATEVNAISTEGIIGSLAVGNTSLTEVFSIDEIKNISSGKYSIEEMKTKIASFISSKTKSISDKLSGAYNSSKAYILEHSNNAVNYGKDVYGVGSSVVSSAIGNRSSVQNDSLSYHDSVLKFLDIIATATVGTELNTKEIKVYVGDDVTASTNGIRIKGVPGFNSLRKLGRGGVNLLTKGMGMYGNLLGGIGSVGGNILKAGGEVFKDAIVGLTDTGRVKDIYLRDGLRKHPVMLARDIKAGLYTDVKTKKIIRKIKDIKGEVIDSEGNVVVTAQDVNKLYTLDGKGVVSRAMSFAGGTFVNLLKPSYYLSKATAGTFKILTEGLNRPKDIYVVGEKTPRINAIGIRSGIYFSKVTQKVIRSINDIDGPVVDFEGNEVISLKDIDNGLVGANGKPIESLRYKLLKGTAKLAVAPIKFAIKAAMGTLKFGWSVVSRGLGIGKEAISRLMGKRKISTTEQAIASETNGILTAIYKLLSIRLPDPTGKFSDTDRDGFRDGSYKDKDGKNDKDTTNKANDSSSKKEASGGFFASLLKKLTGSENDEDEGDTYIAGDLGSDGDNKKKGKSKPKGRFGKLLDRGKGMLKKIPGAGKVAGAAKWIVPHIAKLGVLAGISSIAGGGLGSVVAAGAASIAAIVSLPAILTAGAIAGAGVGSYYLYKYLKNRKEDFGDLFTLRLAQYGISANNKEQVESIIKLEGMITPRTSLTGGSGVIKSSDAEASEMIKIFKINTKDPKEMIRWGVWFNQRFKPIFLAYMSSIKLVNESASLDTIDEKLNVSEKLRLLEYVNFDASVSGPLSITAGPFGLGSIIHGGEAMMIRESLIDKLSKMPSDNNSRKAKYDGRGRVKVDQKAYVDNKVGIASTLAGIGTRSRGHPSSSSTLGLGNSGATAPRDKINIPNSPMKNVIPIASAASGFSIAANSGDWGLPVAGPVSSPFGMRNDPFTGKVTGHSGTDFAASQGTPVYATSAGTITRREYSQSYGNVVYIDHANGMQSRYAHLHSFNPSISTGSVVAKGSLVGYVGNTGHSRGNHLHFEIVDLSKNGKKLNPLAVINDAASKKTIKQLAATEKEISNEVKISQNKDTIEGANTLASTITKESSDKSKDVIASDRMAQLTSIQTLNRDTSIKMESRREQREFENTKTLQNSMERAVIVMQESLAETRLSNSLLQNISSNMGTVAKEISSIGSMRNNIPTAIAGVTKKPTTLSMDKLPVNNTKPA